MVTSVMNTSLGPAVCRMCLCGETSIPYLGNAPGEPLISPCHCKGTMGLYHRSCLEHWLSISRTYCCEICKFRYEIGRRKRGFLSYLRAHSGFLIDDEHERSLASDFACFLIFAPLTIGGSVLCIKRIIERLSVADEKDSFDVAYETLGLGLMAVFLIMVFCFWIFFTVLFYIHDFRVWQRKNLIVYVIDQLDREDEAYSRTNNHFSESQRPLLLRKKIRKFFCCDGQSREDTIIPLRDTAISTLMVEHQDFHDMGSSHQLRVISPIARTSTSSQGRSSSGISSAAITGTSTSQITELRINPSNSTPTNGQPSSSDEVPTLSTFRPYVTSSSASIFPYTSTPRLLVPTSTAKPTSSDGYGVQSPDADVEPTSSVPSQR
uniref:RING-CH-type domain-containing protein n=1 Tax=Haemonchus contortus TaxID=6289 RepID=A0A7I4Y3Z5_HAECO